MPIYIFLLPNHDPRPRQALSTRIRDFDYLGAVLGLSALVSIVLAVNFGGTLYAWNSGQIISLLVVAGACVILFATQQYSCFLTVHSQRMFPVELLSNREYVQLFILMCASNALFVAIYYIPPYFQFTRGDTPIASAVRMLPIVCFVSGSIIVNGALMSKFGYYKPWYIVGSTSALIATVFLCMVPLYLLASSDSCTNQ